MVILDWLIWILKAFWLPFHKYIQRWKRIQRKKMIEKEIYKSSDFFEFQEKAKVYDNLPEIQQWRRKAKSKYYCSDSIGNLLNELRYLQRHNNLDALIKLIRAHSFRNISGILKEQLYDDCFFSTKSLIQEFLDEYNNALEFISRSYTLSNEMKLEFFSEMRHAFGKTALMLSGGASMGLYHAGVVKVFCEAGVMPKIVCGSSAGALVAAILCSKPKSEWRYFYYEPGIDFSAFERASSGKNFFSIIKRFCSEGNILDIKAFSNWLKDNIGDMTFQESFDQTGWILNITVSGHGKHNENMILNYLTSPNVLIWSAAAASCGLPFIFGAQEIMVKDEFGKIVKWIPHGKRKFMDGSIDSDIPMAKIAELFNVNNFIVSQVNPWVIPFVADSSLYRKKNRIKSYVFRVLHLIKNLALSEIIHRTNQMNMIGLLPFGFDKYTNILTQNYIGNVTICPDFLLSDMFTMFDFPNKNIFNRRVSQSTKKALNSSIVLIQK